jgi:hypothetical protein
MAWNGTTERNPRMKRYDSTRVIRVVLAPDQKQWLQSQAVGMESMSAVLRRIINAAMSKQSK